MIYRNTNWTRRNYGSTNVVYQIADRAPRRFNGTPAPAGEWVAAEAIPADMQEIGGWRGYRFFGYL